MAQLSAKRATQALQVCEMSVSLHPNRPLNARIVHLPLLCSLALSPFL